MPPEKIDAVCGMNLEEIKNVKKRDWQGKVFYFCGDDCLRKFNKEPEKFQQEPLIKLRNLGKVFQLGDTEVKVLRGISINIWPGDFAVIIGASGSGKSTVLNMIGLLDRPTSGEVFLGGKDTDFLSDEQRAERRSQIFGFVFQQYNLIPWLTAYENVTLPLLFSDKDLAAGKARSKFQEIGLGQRMSHRPLELSGGEQQRVALLRALVNDPEIILGDEPTGNLDSVTGDKILNILIDLNKKEGKTLVVVTHDADIAAKASHIITLKDGQVIKDHQVHKKIYTE